MRDEGFHDFCESCRWRKKRGARALHRFATGLFSHLKRASGQASIFHFKIAQIWECGCQRKSITISGVDARHERLDEILVCFTPQPTADKRAERFVAVEAFGGKEKIKPH